MKRKTLASAVCALVLTCASADRAEAVDIILQPFCDGMNLNFQGPLIYGERIGSCLASTPVLGGLVIGSTLIVFTTNAGFENELLLYLISLDGTWVNLISIGGQAWTPFNSGTWVVGTPAQVGGAASG